MKIAFICNSIEPGKDGVGDYTMRLAGELIRQGNDVIVLALNDKYVDEVFTGIQQSEGIDIPVMRIPFSLPMPERCILAKKFIDQFDPLWLSLQFVPFGFHAKGLKIGLSQFLLSIGNGRLWHLMFHELWVGMAIEESTKLKWWGRFQRLLIRSMTTKLQPKIIHTQTHLYQAQLHKLGFNAEYLPLFGNIPVTNKTISPPSSAAISFVVFGAIHDGAPIDEFAKEAVLYARKNAVPVKLSFIGRCGSEQDRWVKAWQSAGLAVEIIGEQSPEYISWVLANSTMGISATALAVIEKSGSVAAMREHGLPVLSVSKPWHPAGVPPLPVPKGIIAYKVGNLETCLVGVKRVPYPNNVSDIAAKLVNALSGIS